MADVGDRVRVCSPPARRRPEGAGRRSRSPRRGGGWRPITNWSRSPASPMRGPICSSTRSRSRGEDVAGRGEGVAPCDAVLPAAPFPRRAARTTRRCCWSRRCRAISRRCCAARCARCCATIRSIVTDWINPRNVSSSGGHFRARRLHPAPDRFHPPSSARTAMSSRSASRRSRARRHRRAGAGRRRTFSPRA